MVLPAGSTVPPVPQTVALLAALGAVLWGLRRDAVRVTDHTILALSPWMVAGATVHVVYQLDVLPSSVAPLASSPAVYGTTAVVAGVVWLFAGRTTRPLWWLAGVGVLAVLVPTSVALAVASAGGTLTPTVPLLGVAAGAIMAWITWRLFGAVRPSDATTVGVAGPVVLFAHALDGATTTLGVDVLGFGEKTPLSRIVMEIAGALPTADVIGVGWLFALVKLGLAVAVLALFAGYVRDEPSEGFGLLGLIAAVGLGPASYNVLLFAVMTPTGF